MNLVNRESFGSTGDPEKDMDGREALVETCLSRIFSAYDLGCEEDLVDPVVFLVDCEDTVGASIARGWEGDDAVDAAIMANADSSHDQEGIATTVLTRSVSFADSQMEVPRWFPYLQEVFSHGPTGEGFYLVVITFGGAAVFTVPFSARPT